MGTQELPDWSQPHASGSEHHVWFLNGEVWKLAYAPKTIVLGEDGRLTFAAETDARQYLERIAWTNHLFPEARIDVRGRMNGLVVTVHQAVYGEPVALGEIGDYMKSMGLVGAGTHVKAWADLARGFVLADCHERNFVRKDGRIFAIDVVVRKDSCLASSLNLRILEDHGDDDAL